MKNIIIKGEKLRKTCGRQLITLEVSAANISVWARCKNQVRIHIFNRSSKDIWLGESGLNKKIRGQSFKAHDQDYPQTLSAMKSYLGDLFILFPHEFKILDALDELDGGQKFTSNNFLKLLYKTLKSN